MERDGGRWREIERKMVRGMLRDGERWKRYEEKWREIERDGKIFGKVERDGEKWKEGW